MSKTSSVNIVSALIQLTKPIITLSVAFSALMGFLLAWGSFSDGWLALYVGVLLVAGASSALNQIQEVRYDKLMDRTSGRPIPSGKIPVAWATVWVIVLALGGTMILWILTSPVSAVLALLTLVWYNLIYTPFKRISTFAIIPGAIVGALPPAIGWTAAGASLGHPHIILVAFFFFMGQIPHFWMILLKHGKDYQKGGFPTLVSLFSDQQVTRLTMIWVFGMIAASVFLPLFGVIQSTGLSLLVFLMGLVLLISFRQWLTGLRPVNINSAFIILNMYYLMMMLILMAEGLMR